MTTPLRVLFVSKRYYMRKDLVEDRYGRLFHFPYQLAMQGHQLTCLLTDYHLSSSEPRDFERDGIRWVTVPISRLPRLLSMGAELAADADIVLGSSDCLQINLARRLAVRSGRPVVADLYDNYESFGLARIPGVRSYFRRALQEADAVTCVSENLRAMVQANYHPRGSLTTLNSTIEAGQFFPMDPGLARGELGLAADDRLLGACGGLTPERGIGFFYRAAGDLLDGDPTLKLVLAGTLHDEVRPPDDERVLFLGQLPLEKMNAFYNAMNVNVLHYLDNDFGRYAYPQKLEELVATGRPLVAANVGEMARRFAADEALLYTPDDVSSIRQAVLRQLESPTAYDTSTQSWEDVGQALSEILEAAVEAGKR